VDVIRIDRENTVKSLRDQLQGLVTGDDDSGFPILRQGGRESRMVGYIGSNELEHALSKALTLAPFYLCDLRYSPLDIVADTADAPVSFHTISPHNTDYGSSSISSLIENALVDPFDFSVYMDKAPLTVQTNSPLQLVHEFFVKLGARYVVVTDDDGYCELSPILSMSEMKHSRSLHIDEGVIDKKAWLAFLGQLGDH
jgi:chloride channel 3/4/5